MQKSWYRQIPLTPLGKDAIAELLADLLGDDASIATLAGPIHERTGGNPFFTEEVAQTLIESGHLEGERGSYRLVTPLERLEVPATVQAVLAARIDRLPEREKRVLQVASVIGKDFAEPLLMEVAELPADEVKSSLAELRAAEFVYEQAIFPVVEYSFKHPLTQEVALGSQLKERRRGIHAKVAAAIERQHPDQLEERAALLAHHYEEAGEALAAARWHRRAAEWVEQTDVPASVRHWSRVRAQLRELPGEREATELGIAACQQMLQMGWRVGMGYEEAHALYEEGLALANSIGDRVGAIRLCNSYGRTRCGDGDVTAYLELMIENLSAVSEIDDVNLRSGVDSLYVDALAFAGHLPETLRVAEAGIARCPREVPADQWGGSFHPLAVMQFFKGWSLGWMGRLKEGLEEFGRHRRLCEEDGTPEFIGYNQLYSGEAAYRALEPERALACARQCEELSERLGTPSLAAYAPLAYAFAHLAAGRIADAIEAAQASLERLRRIEKFQACMAAEFLAEAWLEAGDPAAARAAAEEAIELSRRSERLQYEAAAHGVLARALLRSDGAAAREAAEASLERAAALIEQSGAQLLAPSLSEWRAELAGVLGDDAAREALLREAREGYEAVGAPNHAARVAEALDA